MTIINSKIHGIIDYMVVLFLLLSTSLFTLPSMTSKFTYVLAIIHLVLTIATKFELGIFKIIPFKIHGIIELVVSIALVAVAFYLGSVEGDLSRNYYIIFAIAVFLTWLLTDYNQSKKLQK
ncbi:hypothetical protein [Mesonia sp.]|uniref:hypothetical protein n=1 Tax=Mesonia sp. TaxID=1960830 RepID=UPI003F9B93F7